jgi:hypothetical protein
MNKQPTTVGMYLLRRAFLLSLLFVVVIPIALGQTSFNLYANHYKVHGIHTVDLFWNGASSGNVDIYRNGVLVETTANDGAYTDFTGENGSATYTYRACEAGTGICSNQVSVRFGSGGK